MLHLHIIPYNNCQTPLRFKSTGEAVSFGELSECARLVQQTALGIVRANGELCELAPTRDTLIQFKEGERVVVIAEQ